MCHSREGKERRYRTRENCDWPIPIFRYLANQMLFIKHESLRHASENEFKWPIFLADYSEI